MARLCWLFLYLVQVWFRAQPLSLKALEELMRLSPRATPYHEFHLNKMTIFFMGLFILIIPNSKHHRIIIVLSPHTPALGPKPGLQHLMSSSLSTPHSAYFRKKFKNAIILAWAMSHLCWVLYHLVCLCTDSSNDTTFSNRIDYHLTPPK
jgi:hypothetical protein